MLDDLRKNQKSIIWMIAIIFVLGMAVMGIVEIFAPRPYVGKIYGKKISYEEFDRSFRENLNFHRMNNPDQQITDQVMQNINDQTWNQMVARRVMDRQLKRYRIRVKNSDVVNKFRTDPPEELKQNPAFMTNGVFDMNRYFEIIAMDPDFAHSLEQYIREMLPYEKLERRIKDQVVVTVDSVRADWLSRNERASGRVLFFDWNAVPTSEITDADILAFYNKNSSKYKKEASRKYRYVNIPLVASADDTLRAREDIFFVHDLVINGGNFGELATQYSQDPGSAAQQGSLGFFSRGRMVPEFEDVAFSMEVGEISEPFQTNFGWHFMQVTDKRTNDSGEPEVEAGHILIRVEPSDATKMNIRFDAESLFDLAEKIGLEKAAAEHGLHVNETGEFFANATFIPGIGNFPHIVNEAFKNRIGYKPEPIRNHDGSYLVLELSARQAAHVQPLEEVREVVRREVDKERRMAVALTEANRLIAEHAGVNELSDAITEAGFRHVDFTDLLITRSLPTLGVIQPLNRAIFNTLEGEWTPLITGDNGHYKAFVYLVNTPNEELFHSSIDRLTDEYRRTKENTHYNEWYQRVQEEAKVEDLRYRFY